MKENKLLYPSILETSDFTWYDESPVVKSSLSFQAHLLEEMTFDEGKKELVDKYKVWNLTEFATIYEALGGHRGSFSVSSLHCVFRLSTEFRLAHVPVLI